MRARLVPALMILALALSACSGGEGDASPTIAPVTDAPSPSPIPTTREVQPPTEATPEGAAEFVRYFYDQVEKAYAARDPALVEALAAPGCSACERFVTSISSLRDNNQRTEGLVYELLSVVTPPFEGDRARVDVVYNGPEVVRYASDGSVVNREPAAEFVNEQVDVERANGRWTVLEVSRP